MAGLQGDLVPKSNCMKLFNELPGPEKLLEKWSEDQSVVEVNGHLHTPYSFCSFDNIGQMFRMAGQESVKVLGINDFFTAELGEYTHSAVVWYRIIATDDSSASNEETTEWMSVTVSSLSYQGAPALLYGVIGLLGGLALLIFIVLYFRSRK